MPPFYDIYGLSINRNRETIEKFLNYFCYREKVENREGQEIYIVENSKYQVNETLIPIKTMTEIINYGIEHSNHGFSFYIGDNLKAGINEIILKFTYDGKMIFGVSVEEKVYATSAELIDNYKNAQDAEQSIAILTNASKTSIQFEYAPADDEEEFDNDRQRWIQINIEKLKKS